MKELQTLVVPQDNANDGVALVVRLPFAEGAAVRRGDVVAHYENAKMAGELVAEHDGFLRLHCREGQEVAVGQPLASVLDAPVPAPTPSAPAAAPEPPVRAVFSPAARALLERHGLPESAFAGRDFVTSREVEGLAGRPGPLLAAAPAAGLPDGHTLEPLSPEKRTENRLLARVHAEVVASRVAVLLPSEPLLARARAELRLFRKTILPFVLARLPALLEEFPMFHGFHHEGAFARAGALRCGLAVDLGRGLRVVALPPLAGLGLRDIEKAVFARVDRYMRGELTREDLAPGTFTVTDLSGEGAHSVHAVVNHRQAAILSLAGGGGMPFELGLTFDHRLASGRDAARFLSSLRNALEAPSSPGAPA